MKVSALAADDVIENFMTSAVLTIGKGKAVSDAQKLMTSPSSSGRRNRSS